MNDTTDLALEALLSASRDRGDAIPESLLRKIYVVEKKHQFEGSRDDAIKEIRDLVENWIDSDRQSEVAS